MSRPVIVKPLINEKAERLSESNNQYTFIVQKKANKIEIRKAVESLYSVNVTAVRTCILPGSIKAKHTKSGMVMGRKPSFKKAIVSVKDGEMIDYYDDI